MNLTAPFLLIQAVLPAMKAQRYGRIVNISSTAGRMVSTLGGAHYTASKTGLLGLTRAAAKELGRYGITVNAVCPGMIDTELTRESAPPDVLERLATRLSGAAPRHGARSRRPDLLRRIRARRLHHRRVARHQRRRPDDVGAVVKEGTRVLVALGAGLAGGLADRARRTDARCSAPPTSVAPIGTLWVNAIRMTVIPLVVSLLITGVASASDVSTIGRIGGRTLVGLHRDAGRCARCWRCRWASPTFCAGCRS